MRILLLIPEYLGLYKPIVSELEKEGHKVHVLFDINIPCDPYYKRDGHLRKIAKTIVSKLTHNYSRYWKNVIRKDKELTLPFDAFVCVNGSCLSGYLMTYLRKKNTKIRTSIYLWDNNYIYDFARNLRYFDKRYTYDLLDSKKYNIKFLPFYWTCPDSAKTVNKNLYAISIVGTDHDDRFDIVRRLSGQLDKSNLNYKFVIVSTSRVESKGNSKISIISKPLSPNETMRIMSQSTCILDTDRPSQTGTTPRVIWALSMGKKIITTNTSIKEMPFYDSRQILIIDRDNPVIDLVFISSTENIEVSPYIENLRIDKWVKNFL